MSTELTSTAQLSITKSWTIRWIFKQAVCYNFHLSAQFAESELLNSLSSSFHHINLFGTDNLWRTRATKSFRRVRTVRMLELFIFEILVSTKMKIATGHRLSTGRGKTRISISLVRLDGANRKEKPKMFGNVSNFHKGVRPVSSKASLLSIGFSQFQQI